MYTSLHPTNYAHLMVYEKGNQPLWSIYHYTSYTMFILVLLGGNWQVLHAKASWQYELAAQHHNVDVNGHVQLRARLH